VDPAGSGQGPVAGSCECGDEPSGSGATELVIGPYYIEYFSAAMLVSLVFRTLGLQDHAVTMPTDNSYIKFNNNTVNSLQT
jgi:hypothetical protein